MKPTEWHHRAIAASAKAAEFGLQAAACMTNGSAENAAFWARQACWEYRRARKLTAWGLQAARWHARHTGMFRTLADMRAEGVYAE